MEDSTAYWKKERQSTFCDFVKKDFKEKIVARKDKELEDGKMWFYYMFREKKKIKTQYYLQV